MKKIIREGEIIPKYYGIAYRRIDMFSAVCYPIPLNIIAALLYKAVIWFKHGHKLYDNGYTRGYDEGKESGRQYAFYQYRDQVIAREVESIVRNFWEEYMSVIEEYGKGNKERADGFIFEFIEKEKKRIKNL